MRVVMIQSVLTLLILLKGLTTTDAIAGADQNRLPPFALLSLSIVEVSTGEEIVSNLINGDTTCLSLEHPSAKSLTVVAITTNSTNGIVAFDWDYGNVVRVESRPPYALAGATNGPQQPIYHAANSLTLPGDHKLSVRVSRNALSFPTSISTCHDRFQRDDPFDYQEMLTCPSIKAVSEITIQIKVGECLPSIPDISSKTEDKKEAATHGYASHDTLPSRLISARNVVEIRGDLRQRQKITLLFNGPIGSERGGTMPIPHGTRAPNLFADYLFQMEFHHAATGTSLSIPGHFAADGHAAITGAVSGHVWACHFRPPLSGVWRYTAHFKYGIDIARSDLSINSTTTAHFFDGHSGVLHIVDSGSEYDVGSFQKNQATPIGRDYYQLSHSPASNSRSFANTHIFDSTDFDGYDDCRIGNQLRKRNVLRHEKNTNPEDASPSSPYSWDHRSKRPKGLESIAMIQHKSTQNVTHLILPLLFQADNSYITPFVCQTTMNKTIPPQLAVRASPNSPSRSNTCGAFNDTESEESTKRPFSEVIETDKTRIDVSKTDQWSRILDWATERIGVTLQLQLEDESTARILDDDSNSLGPQRKLYYREVVSRFGHYPNLIWDLGHDRNKLERRQYLSAIDPYHHAIL